MEQESDFCEKNISDLLELITIKSAGRIRNDEATKN